MLILQPKSPEEDISCMQGDTNQFDIVSTRRLKSSLSSWKLGHETKYKTNSAFTSYLVDLYRFEQSSHYLHQMFLEMLAFVWEKVVVKES